MLSSFEAYRLKFCIHFLYVPYVGLYVYWEWNTLVLIRELHRDYILWCEVWQHWKAQFIALYRYSGICYFKTDTWRSALSTLHLFSWQYKRKLRDKRITEEVTARFVTRTRHRIVTVSYTVPRSDSGNMRAMFCEMLISTHVRFSCGTECYCEQVNNTRRLF